MYGPNWTRITINITKVEREALHRLAEAEFRDTRQQASIIIRSELERRGLIQPNNENNDQKQQGANNG